MSKMSSVKYLELLLFPESSSQCFPSIETYFDIYNISTSHVSQMPLVCHCLSWFSSANKDIIKYLSRQIMITFYAFQDSGIK